MSDRWTATALVHSGRPDPEWTVDDNTAERLLRIWEHLPMSSSPPPEAPPLGYRGASFHDGASGRSWFVLGGVVASEGVSREDVGDEFARTLLATAPADSLPPWLRL
jgi:hypothetical protein